MGRYKFYNKRDRERTVLGTIITDDQGVIVGWENLDGEDDGFFLFEIEGKETLDHACSHTPSIGVIPEGVDGGESVTISLDDRLREVRARRGQQEADRVTIATEHFDELAETPCGDPDRIIADVEPHIARMGLADRLREQLAKDRAKDSRGG